MQFLKNTSFFTTQFGKKLVKKKWATLLLFLMPIILCSLPIYFISSILNPPEELTIQVGLVDGDHTTESELLTLLFVEMVSEEGLMNVEVMTEQEAQEKISANELSAYFTLPKGFTDDLYNGISVVIPIVGNGVTPTDGFIVKEVMDSMTRLLSTAQANILAIYDFSKEIDMPQADREEMLIEQFVDFTFFTLGKDKMLVEEEITNIATSDPVHYYAVSFLFILLTIWIIGFLTLLSEDEQEGMNIRLRLLGVTIWQQAIAKMFITLVGLLIWISITFYGIQFFLSFNLYAIDYVRIALFVLLYSVQLIGVLVIVQLWINSKKMGLLVQVVLLVLVILLSGALIPTLYFPEILQTIAPYVFSTEAFNWLIDLLVEERNYADYTFLLLSALMVFLILYSTSFVKERWRQ